MGLISTLQRIAGEDHVLTHRHQLRTYESDGLTQYAELPLAVVLPGTAAEVREVVAACHADGVPWVARGSGSGLSGGALPVEEGVLIALTRLRRVLEVDLPNQRVTVEPGVTNVAVSHAVAPTHFYPPDPSSQIVCSIGGNVAENSGGAHCFKYGFTTNYVTGLEVVLPDGQVAQLGGKGLDPPGLDLIGAFVGSEGTLGVATKITLRVVPAPESVETLVAFFESTAAAGEVVSAIVAAGIVPGAIEMMDNLSIRAAEGATGAGYPLDAGAALIVELDGPSAECAARFGEVEALCREGGATGVRVAADAAERELIWKTRKAAFAAMGRIAPNYYVQDSVIPRTRLGPVLQRIDELARRVRPEGGERLPRRRREPASPRLLRRLGGGRARARRGAGRPDREDLRGRGRLDHRRARRGRGQEGLHAADVRRARPGHVPAAALRLRPGRPGQPGQGDAHPAAVRRGARALPATPARGGGDRGADVIEHNAGDLTAVVSADTRLGELQDVVGGAGQMLALDPPGDPTLGALVAANASGPLRHRYGSARDLVLGIRVRLADGTEAKAGGKVIKNVAGYDLAKLFTGSSGSLGRILEVSVRLHPLPAATATTVLRSADPAALQAAALEASHRPLELQSLDVRWEDGEGALLARVGRAEPVSLGPGSEVIEDDDAEWARQRDGQRARAGGVMVRVSGLQTQLADVLRFGARVVGRAGLGLSWVETDDVDGLRAALAPSPCVVVEAPDGFDGDRHGPVDPGALELMRRVRERFAA